MIGHYLSEEKIMKKSASSDNSFEYSDISDSTKMWCKLRFWTPEETAALMQGRDPSASSFESADPEITSMIELIVRRITAKTS